MCKVIVTPENNRQRQLVREHGNVWRVKGKPWRMPVFNGNMGIQIETLDGTHSRNILVTQISNNRV